jgi:hypothetical protein
MSSAGSEVPTALTVKSTVFWDITTYIPLKVNRRFGGICRARNQLESVLRFPYAFMLVSFSAYSPTLKMEAICLRNVDLLSTENITE